MNPSVLDRRTLGIAMLTPAYRAAGGLVGCKARMVRINLKVIARNLLVVGAVAVLFPLLMAVARFSEESDTKADLPHEWRISFEGKTMEQIAAQLGPPVENALLTQARLWVRKRSTIDLILRVRCPDVCAPSEKPREVWFSKSWPGSKLKLVLLYRAT